MNKSLSFVAIALAALIAAPASLAAPWMSYGTTEPSTGYDTSAWMWQEAPGVIKNRIYFNAYAAMNTQVGSGVNPNVAAAGTNNEIAMFEVEYAVLGVWTDCNGDGYIGMAETAAREYRSELLSDTSLCPNGGGVNTPGGANNAWNGANNYAGWVTELIPIGSGETTNGDRRVIKDKDAAVWGDFGRPEDDANDAGGTCAISPPPRGTLQSSGGLITYADCRSGLIESWNTAMAAAGDPAALSFSDEADGESGALGQQTTLGDTDSDNAIVKAQDCNAAPLVAAGEEGQGVRPPSTEVNEEGTVAGTINYTFESAPLPSRSAGDDNQNDETADCDTSNDFGEEPYSLVESQSFTSTSASDKREAVWNLAFSTMTRGGVPLGGLTGPAGGPDDAGLEPFNALCTVCQESEWASTSQLTKAGPPPGPRSVVLRTDVGNGDVGADIDEAYWLTFYATVGPTSLLKGVLPGGGQTAKYGADQCGANSAGIFKGWNCDASLWNRDASGAPQNDPYGALAYPGKTYVLRDVDCYDGEVKGTGLGLSPVFFGTQNCAAG